MAWDANKCKHRKCPNGHEWACTSKRCPECNEFGDVVCKDRVCEKCGHKWKCYLVNCPECDHKNPIATEVERVEQNQEL